MFFQYYTHFCRSLLVKTNKVESRVRSEIVLSWAEIKMVFELLIVPDHHHYIWIGVLHPARSRTKDITRNERHVCDHCVSSSDAEHFAKYQHTDYEYVGTFESLTPIIIKI